MSTIRDVVAAARTVERLFGALNQVNVDLDKINEQRIALQNSKNQIQADLEAAKEALKKASSEWT